MQAAPVDSMKECAFLQSRISSLILSDFQK